MADSMCGPSNALQNFQKQSQGDRTLQQDRLSNRTPQSQGFRTAGPSAHNLDPEFEVFQAGQLPLQHPEAGFHPGFQHAHTPQPQQRMNAGPGASWANDFQRLAIASPGMQQQGLPQAQHAGGWHQEFAQMNNTQSGMPQQQGQQHSYNAPLERLSSLATTPFGMNQQPMYQTPLYQPAPQTQPSQPHHLNPEVSTFDEAAFAAAFDQAAQSELQSEQASLSHALQEGHLAPAPIGADAIHHPDAPSQPLLTPAQESDDLARTAGALLTSVQGDQSDKFANSQFLQLMRQLRDKEVVVEGDAIMPAGAAGQGGPGGAENPTPFLCASSERRAWGWSPRAANADTASDADALTKPPRQSQRGGVPTTTYRGAAGRPMGGAEGRRWARQDGMEGGEEVTPRIREYQRANGRGADGTPYPMQTREQVAANFERHRADVRRREEREERARREMWERGEETTMPYRRAGGGYAPQVRVLKTRETPVVMLAGAEEERAARVVGGEGWGGVRERLKDLRERMAVEEGRLREVAEEEVREQLAREGRSWGES
ncbi:hypothetical protein VE03_01165 [Pseudogymnoascus sp. 23342-1-I1]|nr:hypothetical protein VE03_01165 [Pseudogymnoascus sp. 23342-1-I1]